MRDLVYWFLAPSDDAAAIRSVATSGAHKREEWPHLVLPGIDGPDMNQLEKLVRPKRPKGSSRIGGELLDRGQMSDTPFTAVSRVASEFVQALAALDEPGIRGFGQAWAGAIDGITDDSAVLLVGRMADFARQGATAGQPVLELDIM